MNKRNETNMKKLNEFVKNDFLNYGFDKIEPNNLLDKILNINKNVYLNILNNKIFSIDVVDSVFIPFIIRPIDGELKVIANPGGFSGMANVITQKLFTNSSLEIDEKVISKKITSIINNQLIEYAKKSAIQNNIFNFKFDDLNSDKLYNYIIEISKYVKDISKRDEANNIIINNEIYLSLLNNNKIEINNNIKSNDICYVGDLKNTKIKIYVDNMWISKNNEIGDILFMFRGDYYDVSFIYNFHNITLRDKNLFAVNYYIHDLCNKYTNKLMSSEYMALINIVK